MKIRLTFSSNNTYPLSAVFIPGAKAVGWLRSLDFMGFDVNDVVCYAIPGLSAGEITGCIAIARKDLSKTDIGSNMRCQCAGKFLFIPANTLLLPEPTDDEIKALCRNKRYFIHPSYGVVELSEPIQWKRLIQEPVPTRVITNTPKQADHFPQELNSIRIMPADPAEALAKFEEINFPKTEQLPNKPLTIAERLKLFFYTLLFRPKTGISKEPPGWIKKVPFFSWLFNRAARVLNKLQEDYESLEKRNEKAVDKLVRLLKDNPELGLKYALPLDDGGFGRGKRSDYGEFFLKRIWRDFTLFGSDTPRNGALALLSDHSYFALQQQYRDTAAKLIKSGNFKHAAFIYLKLLKDPYEAADCLERGGFYAEAAALYLKKINNPSRAAECFAKGGMHEQAIDIYKKQKEFEKVGDLYTSIRKTSLANQYYQMVVDEYLKTRQFLKAASTYQVKMNNLDAAKEVCLTAWKNNAEMSKCMKFYFNCFADDTEQAAAIEKIYQTEVNQYNSIEFLDTIKDVYQKNKANQELLKQIGYEIISAKADTHPDIVSILSEFNRKDQQLMKDTFRFKRSTKR